MATSDETKRAESDLDKIERILRAMAGRAVEVDGESLSYEVRKRSKGRWQVRAAIVDEGGVAPFGSVTAEITAQVRPSHDEILATTLVAVRAAAKARAAALTGAVDE